MLRTAYEKLIRPILVARDSPPALAGGIAIGIGVALTPTVGIQMPLAWLFATLCGANRVVAVALVWISNPVTVLPLYYLEYLFGSFLLRRSSITSYQHFTELWESMAQMGYLDRIAEISEQVAFPLVVGSIVPAVFLGVMAYPVSLWWIRWRAGKRPQPAAANADTAKPAALKSEPRKSPDALAGLLFFGLALLMACTRSNVRVSKPGVPSEATMEGTMPVWSAVTDDGTLVIVTPLYSAVKRDQFARKKIESFLRLDGSQHQFVALALYRFGDQGEPLSLGADGLSVRFDSEAGSGVALPPSEFLTVPPFTANRSLLRSVFGFGALPELASRQSLRLWLVLPTTADLAAMTSMEVNLDGDWVRLSRGKVTAVAFNQFYEEPALETFQTALAEFEPLLSDVRSEDS